MHEKNPEPPPDAPDILTEDTIETVVYPVESPLSGVFQADTGVLTLDSTIQAGDDLRKLIRLRLVFAPDAAHGFVRLLQAVADQLGVGISELCDPAHEQ